MLVALISDLHGNLIALEAVLEDLERERPDRVVCLGDVAATGPQPRETVERLHALGYLVVMGNADAELLRPIPEPEGEEARRVAEIDRWCAGELSQNYLEYIRGFRATLEVSLGTESTLLCFHGSPRSFDETIAATTQEKDLDEALSGHEAAVMAGGHTHAQLARRHRGTTILNPGSVGLNPPAAEYGLVAREGDRLRVGMRQLPLDTVEMRDGALESGMPHAGWWASLWEEG